MNVLELMGLKPIDLTELTYLPDYCVRCLKPKPGNRCYVYGGPYRLSVAICSECLAYYSWSWRWRKAMALCAVVSIGAVLLSYVLPEWLWLSAFCVFGIGFWVSIVLFIRRGLPGVLRGRHLAVKSAKYQQFYEEEQESLAREYEEWVETQHDENAA